MLLNVAIFIWFGAVCPWYQFAHNNVIPIYRLIFLGILVLLLRRLPIIFILHKKIPQIEEVRQALFVGFFGPIGVSAIFYLYVTVDFLHQVTIDGTERHDAEVLTEVVTVVVWFLAICSIVSGVLSHPRLHSLTVQVVHGLSIPLGKLSLYLPRTISHALSTEPEDEPEPFHIRQPVGSDEHVVDSSLHRRRAGANGQAMPMFRIGRAVARSVAKSATPAGNGTPRGSTPRDASPVHATASGNRSQVSVGGLTPIGPRSIRFGEAAAPATAEHGT